MTTPDETEADLVALVGSRMAHDLANPLGAIANGLELLELTGLGGSPEFDLIAASVDNANRKIKWFRLAFGAAAPGQTVSGAEIADLIAPVDGRRLAIDWAAGADLPRAEVKKILLGLMCAESAAPFGGSARVIADGTGWRIEVIAERLAADPGLWAVFSGAAPAEGLAAGQVHFALLAREAARTGRPVSAEFAAGAMLMRL
ncbi:MAG: histidine phosphotransferase [Alphaproteobacteria bacterium]|nr:MAG: histidine phosphotransferase [Alphaproteobacteria bacterium]